MKKIMIAFLLIALYLPKSVCMNDWQGRVDKQFLQWADKYTQGLSQSNKLRQKEEEKLTMDLFYAITLDRHNEIKEIVQKYPDGVNERRCWLARGGSVTPLHVAVALRNVSAVELLLALHAAPNAISQNRADTPLHWARDRDIAEALIQKGARVNENNYQQIEPIQSVLFGSARFCGGHYEVADCLIKHGVDINKPIDKQNNRLLHTAIQQDDPIKSFNDVKFLLEHNADPEEQWNNDVISPFYFALLYKKFSLMPLFNLCGLDFFPHNSCKKVNPRALLKNNASYLKELIRLDKAKRAVNFLAQLFMFIQYNEKRLDAYERVFKHRITSDEHGDIFWRATVADLEEFVGKESVDYVKRDLRAICLAAVDTVREGTLEEFMLIATDYPFVLSYDNHSAFLLWDYIKTQGAKVEAACKKLKRKMLFHNALNSDKIPFTEYGECDRDFLGRYTHQNYESVIYSEDDERFQGWSHTDVMTTMSMVD